MISSILLVCAVLASLASGVLIAYSLLLSMFALFRIHARQVAAVKAAHTATVTLPALQS